MGRYRTFEHTADVGIEVEGETVAELFAAAGEAFCDVVCDRSTVRRLVERRLTVQRKNREEQAGKLVPEGTRQTARCSLTREAHQSLLLQGFLSELLYRFETEHELYSSVEIGEIAEGRVTAVVKGEKIDPKVHEIKTGIKAVTFHQLKIWQEGAVWKARMIFDV